MSLRPSLMLVAALLVAVVHPADAARIRYHFSPCPGGNGSLSPAAAGQRLTLGGWQSYNCPPPRATQLVPHFSSIIA